MARTTTANYLTELANLQKTPCAIVEFDIDTIIWEADFEDTTLESFSSFNSPNVFANSTVEAFSGTRSVLVEESTSGFAGGRRTFPAVAGRSYRVECWAQRTIGTGQTDTHFLVSGDVTEFSVASVTPLVFSEWEKLILTSTAYASNGTVTVEIAAQNGDQIFFDDIKVTELGKLTRRYASNTFSGITSDDKKFMKGMFMGLVNIDLLKGHSETGLTNIRILDKDLDFSGIMRDDDMENRKLIIRVGFDALVDTDFVEMPAVKTTRIELDAEHLIWTLIAKDIRRKLRDQIFRFEQRGTLNGAYSAGDSSVTVDSTTGFIDPSNLPSEYAWFGVGIKVGGTILRYASITSTTFSGLVRGFLLTGTEDADQGDGAEVTQVFLFNDNSATFLASPILNFLNILLTTLDGKGHQFYDLTRYDLGFAGLGLAIDESEVDILGIENIRMKTEYNTILNESIGIGRLAIGEKPESALPWLEQNIFRPFGIFPFWTEDSKITLGTFDHLETRVGFSASRTIDNDDIVDGTLKVMNEELINIIEVRTKVKIGDTKIVKSRRFQLDSSVASYNGKTQRDFVIEHDLWNESTAQDDDYIANNYLRRWFYFWGNVPGRFTIRTLASAAWLVEPGDLVLITYSKFPELKGSSPATRGWTAKPAIITSQKVEWAGDIKTFVFEGLTWELFDRVSPFTTESVILEGAITRNAMTFQTSANNTATLQAEDAYTEVSPQESRQAFKIKIKVTQPNSGTNFHHLFNIGVHVQSPTGTDVFNKSFPTQIRFFTGNADVFEFEMFFVRKEGAVNVDRVKIDPFSLRTVANAAVPAAETPTVEFIELGMATLSETISLVTP